VIFPHIHEPGEAAQSDLTYLNSLGMTLGGVPSLHLVFHLVLVYSNVETIEICFSESYESRVEGFETCLWQVCGYVGDDRAVCLAWCRCIGVQAGLLFDR